MAREGRGAAPYMDATLLGARPAFASAGAHQVALELDKPPKTVSINRPCAVVKSAHASRRERKPAPALAIRSSVFKRSRASPSGIDCWRDGSLRMSGLAPRKAGRAKMTPKLPSLPSRQNVQNLRFLNAPKLLGVSSAGAKKTV